MKQIREFVLASESPRRKSLLEDAGFQVTVFPVKVSEILEKNLTTSEQILAISRTKFVVARDLWTRTKDQESLILTADTMVVLDDQALGKPHDFAEAVSILAKLSGKAHQVMTAVTLGLSSSSQIHEAITTTQVFFRPILRQEIEEYIRTGEPMDKAGAYGIQGLGKRFVEKYEGPYDNVVGLPVATVREICLQNQWALPTVIQKASPLK